ncbi:hypothetical protein CUT44_01445 [Streptomyces carminius]|uniref:Sodium:proton antiporter n=1 Tax=Streptomyces carminius TaxID=2665496 RepID=A0A2M8MC48_9ACTN|nr:DUF6328 family protein [Streptomyces carminius]PJE97951.1 hypothetical protein CUT44_09700 [Streptomyces carminius]PJF01778.1 hypothetical protein CUT44_01445 [Streptomyces carminius]
MDERRETPLERDDRNFVELLQELRVIQVGVQILFAFLLTLAFTQRFTELDAVQRGTYLTTLLLAVASSILFTAPAALHRVLFRRGAKRLIVEVSSRLAGAGLVVLALALTGAVLLVVDVVLGRTAGIAVAAGVLAFCGAVWALLPFGLRRRVPGAGASGAGRPPDRTAGRP